MESQGMAIRVLFVTIMVMVASIGCRAETVVTANLVVGAVPCVLMYLVLNLKSDK